MKKLIPAAIEEYFWNLALGLDQLLNVVLGGYPDETVSSRVHRKARAGQWFWLALRRVIDGAFKIVFRQDDHCRKSYDREAARGHSPREFADG